jgi:enamine deaminase RidA (YjgF/YER057c/UK114 family)
LIWPQLEAAQRKKKKKDEEPVTQTLEVLKEPPVAVVVETRKLVFHVSPLSSKGLLSQQVREALKALSRAAGRATIVKLRGFVAGTGDVRRVQAIVSETFTDRRLPLPTVSVVQVGGLPMEGAQVVLESIATARRDVNPAGLAFISGQAEGSDNPLQPAAPLARKSLESLRAAVRGVGSELPDVVRVTCFMSTLEDVNDVRRLVAADYPRAAMNFVQVQRAPFRGIVECEAVAKLRTGAKGDVEFRSPHGLPKSPNYSQSALISAPRIVLTGSQVAFGFQDSDVRLAFQRLGKALESFNASLEDVAFASFYPVSGSVAQQVIRIRKEFYDMTRPPATTNLPFEGLPSLDASVGVDVVAIPRK